jgi:hypothetical protein
MLCVTRCVIHDAHDAAMTHAAPSASWPYPQVKDRFVVRVTHMTQDFLLRKKEGALLQYAPLCAVLEGPPRLVVAACVRGGDFCVTCVTASLRLSDLRFSGDAERWVCVIGDAQGSSPMTQVTQRVLSASHPYVQVEGCSVTQ